LKLRRVIDWLMGLGCLNRTSVGLKLRFPRLAMDRGWKPQSNQRGIETIDLSQMQRMRTASLNRTSVGLKRSLPGWFCWRAFRASIEPAWD